MTVTDVVFDTSAWVEFFGETPKGAGLKERYYDDDRVTIHTSAITMGELATRLPSDAALLETTLAGVRGRSRVHDVTAEGAVAGAKLRPALRLIDRTASLADGIILALARELGARLATYDGAFKGLPETDEDDELPDEQNP